MPKTKPRTLQVGAASSEELPPFLQPAPAAHTYRIRVSEAVRALGEVVYGVRTFDGLIKIGYSRNFRRRIGGFGITQRNIAERLMFLIPGTLEDEQTIHSCLRDHIARGREYYHPTAEVMEFVNDIRADWGLSPVCS